jgi:aspartate aminotransferase
MRKISERIGKIPVSPHRQLVAKVDALRRAGRDVYNYSAGQPGLPPDEEALELFCRHMLKEPFIHTKYVPTRGLYELREAISQDLKKYGGIDIDPGNIVVTIGGVEGLVLALNSVTDPGDEILMFDPSYSTYWSLVKYLGLKVKTCKQTVENGFQPDPECIKEKITDKTAAILFASPDNPTSRIISDDVAKTIMDIALEKKVWVLYDVAYKHVVYEGTHIWLENYPGADEVLITINSFSKDIAIPGFRLGYVYGPRDVINEMAKMKGFISITSPTPAQYLAYYYLTSGIKEKYLKYALEVYRKRRDAAYEAFRKYLPDAKIWKPPASMYLFPDLSVYLEKLGIDDIEFTFRLADAKAVVMLPGAAFGEAGKYHIRATFVTQDEDRLVKGIQLLAEYLNESIRT